MTNPALVEAAAHGAALTLPIATAAVAPVPERQLVHEEHTVNTELADKLRAALHQPVAEHAAAVQSAAIVAQPAALKAVVHEFKERLVAHAPRPDEMVSRDLSEAEKDLEKRVNDFFKENYAGEKQHVLLRVRSYEQVRKLVRERDALAASVISLGEKLNTKVLVNSYHTAAGELVEEYITLRAGGVYETDELITAMIYIAADLSRMQRAIEVLQAGGEAQSKQLLLLTDVTKDQGEKLLTQGSELRDTREKAIKLDNMNLKPLGENERNYVIRHRSRDGVYIGARDPDFEIAHEQTINVRKYRKVRSVGRAIRFGDLSVAKKTLRLMNKKSHKCEVTNPHRYEVAEIILAKVPTDNAVTS